MKNYFIYIEYKDGTSSDDSSNGYKELMTKLKDIHGYKDYDLIEVHEVIEDENGELEFYLTNYK